jgi:hypothetical protein
MYVILPEFFLRARLHPSTSTSIICIIIIFDGQRNHAPMGHRGPQESPRLKLAALQLTNDSDLDVCDALLSAGYRIGEINQAKRKAVSRQKIRYKSELEKKNRQRQAREFYVMRKAKLKSSIASGESADTNISSLTDPQFDNCDCDKENTNTKVSE